MQIVGSQCATCAKPLNFAPDGLACTTCEDVYHKACLADGVTCPGCGENLEAQSAKIEKQEREDMAERLRTGRAQFFLAVFLLGGLMLFNAIASLAAADLPDVMRLNPWTGLVISAGLLVALWLGHFVARVLVGLQIGFGILCQVGLLHRLHQDNGLATVVMNSWIMGVLLASFYFLCLSPTVSLYVESNRTHKRA